MKRVPEKRNKVIVIVGPTASGKSAIAVRIAKRFNGEVVSADSRQVYRELDVASGKITKTEMAGIPHHLLDVADPKRAFTVARYQKLASRALSGILKRGKIPVICGGTGHYIQAVADGVVFPGVKPDLKFRKRLAALSAAELAAMLRKLDPKRHASIDAKNPRRTIRAIEIARALGSVPEPKRITLPYSVLKIGITAPDETLRKNIEKRTADRMRRGMVAEANRLIRQGISPKRLRELGLEYRALADHIEKKIGRDELIERINREDRQYAKRQMTWFKKDREIRWFSPSEIEDIMKAIETFLA